MNQMRTVLHECNEQIEEHALHSEDCICAVIYLCAEQNFNFCALCTAYLKCLEQYQKDDKIRKFIWGVSCSHKGFELLFSNLKKLFIHQKTI